MATSGFVKQALVACLSQAIGGQMDQGAVHQPVRFAERREIHLAVLVVVQSRSEGDRMAFFVGEYALVTLFLAWVALWGGAARLEGSFFAELVAFGGVTVTADGLKVLAWCVWLLHTGWFLWGLGDPSVRLF